MKLKTGIYWGAGCGGCDVAVLDVHEKLLAVAEKMDLLFWPIAMDFKYDDVRARADGEFDIVLYNGAVRNSENEEIAKLLRRKSKVLVALGACAHMGGLPGLANFHTREDILNRVYLESESTVNPEGVIPQERWKKGEEELELPRFYNTVKTLDQVVEVDYYIPGCPPVPSQIISALTAVWEGALPEKGSIIGAGTRTLCDECPRNKEEKEITIFKRPVEMIPEPDKCLLEQGLICLGPVTREGCGARCINSNVPCRGCYGPLDGVSDQGMRMLGALASVLEPKEEKEIDALLSQVVDPLRTFHRFSMAASILRRKKV
ncbi:MAG: oxidoreductase [Candidatus Krumholzibacteriota bacterium]|nr:oxidoreductase [Candidatus Krumholzibacteriota bacterium]